MPIAFTVGDRAVRIERRVSRAVVIPLAGVRAVASLPGPLPTPPLPGRDWGTFGYLGKHRSRALGPFVIHATRLTDLVLLETDDGHFLLSPEPAGAFVGMCPPAPDARLTSSRGPEAPPGARRARRQPGC